MRQLVHAIRIVLVAGTFLIAASAAAQESAGIFSGSSEVRTLIHNVRSPAAPTLQRLASLRELSQRRRGLTPEQARELLFVGRDLMHHDPSPAVRREAIGMFAAVAVASREANVITDAEVSDDVRALTDIAVGELSTDEERVAAVKALRRLDAGLGVLEKISLVAAVQQSPETLRAIVVAAAAMAKADAVPLITRIAQASDEENVLASAAFALGETGSASAIPELLRLRGFEGVRISAVDALVKLGPGFLNVLDRGTEGEIVEALAAVADLWTPELRQAAISRVLQLLRTAPVTVAREAVHTLIRIAAMETAEAERALLSAARDAVRFRGDLDDLLPELENRAGSVDLVPSASDVPIPARTTAGGEVMP